MRKLAAFTIVALLMSIQMPATSNAQTKSKGPANAVAPNPNDPLYQTKGDNIRAYTFPVSGENIPYRLFVPSKWTKDAKLPMLVIFHSGNSVNVPFERGEGVLARVAEQRGYIVLAPQGYSTSPRFNSPYTRVPDPAAKPSTAPPLPKNGQKWGEKRRTGRSVRNGPGGPGIQRRSDSYLSVLQFRRRRRRVVSWRKISGALGVDCCSLLARSCRQISVRSLEGHVASGCSRRNGAGISGRRRQEKRRPREAAGRGRRMDGRRRKSLEAWTKVFPQMLDDFDRHKKK